MWQHILDLGVSIIFIYIALTLWRVARRKQNKQVKLLLKTVSIFIILYLILFPLFYMTMINQNAESIKIEKEIVNYERNEKLVKALEQKTEIEQRIIRRQRPKLISLVTKYSSNLSQIQWESIDNIKIIQLDSFMVQGKTEKVQIPGGDYYKEIEVYDVNGLKQFQFTSKSTKNTMLEIFKDHLDEIETERKGFNEKITLIEKNQFWTYRQILPYTLNILFTDNFSPQSRMSNLIYFIHNILVVGFLISIIMNLFQYYLLNNK